MTPEELLRAVAEGPDYGKSWWAPSRDALVCRHFGADGAVLELETDTRRERATRVFLSLGKLP